MYLVEAATFYGLTNNRLQHFCEGTVRQHFNERHVLPARCFVTHVHFCVAELFPCFGL